MTRLPAILTVWDWRLDLILIMALAGIAFTAGWLRLRRRGRRQLATDWRLVSYWGGLIVSGIASMSPVDTLGGQLFFMHMIQHLLIVMIAVPLLLLANPFPFIVWGLPGGQSVSEYLFRSQSPFRNALRQATRPGIVWMAFVAILWGWHDPALYSAAQGNFWVHDLQHVTFFGSAMLLWWHVIGAGPRIHGRLVPLARIGMLVATGAANMIPGVVIALAQVPLYPYYANVARPWGISVLQDQSMAGLIMWIPGTMMYLLTALAIVIRMLNRSESQLRRERRPQPIGVGS